MLSGLNDRLCWLGLGVAYVAFTYSHRVVIGSVNGAVVGCWSAVVMAPLLLPGDFYRVLRQLCVS